jgi:hypothetical protein
MKVAQFGKGAGERPTVYQSAGRSELLAFFAAQRFRRGAEIGVWRGGFSVEMCKALPGLELRCVDAWGGDPTYHETKGDGSWGKIRAEAERRLEPFGCVIDARPSLKAAASVEDGSLDFVYVDANHGLDAVYADLVAWTPKVRAGGVVAGHDYREFPARPLIQVKAAVDQFVRDHGIKNWAVLSREACPSFVWSVL